MNVMHLRNATNLVILVLFYVILYCFNFTTIRRGIRGQQVICGLRYIFRISKLLRKNEYFVILLWRS